MNLLLETDFFGGSGGMEKLVKDIISVKPKNLKIDIFISSNINSDPSYRMDDVRFVDLNEIEYKKYDIFLKIGMNYSYELFKFLNDKCKKIINPAGYLHNEKILPHFNYLWQESPDSYKNKFIKEITLCPPVIVNYKELNKNQIVENVSKKFYVTAANDYDPNIKGLDLIYEFAYKSPYDLVWFCSDNKLPTNNLLSSKDTPKNLKIARNMPKNIIFDTIKKSYAYICFSRRESFGYSIAESIILQKPIFTQKVGLVKYEPDLFYIYDEENIMNILNINPDKNMNYTNYLNKFNNFWESFFECIGIK